MTEPAKPSAEVVGIGSCTVDYFAIVPRLLGPEEKTNADRLEIHAGGVTANNLTQFARLGAKAGWLGLLGDDANGKIIEKAFLDDGMDISGIEVVKDALSSLTWIPVDYEGERCIYMFPNVTGKISEYQVLNRFAPHINLDVSPNFFCQCNLGTQEELAASLRFVDVLKPCKAAAIEFTGEDDPEKMARKLLEMGPKTIAITMGANGCLLASKDKTVHVPAFTVKPIDTTGAGDAFMGGLSFGLLQNWDLERVGAFANACAALCCTKVGARAMAKFSEVISFIREQRPAFAANI
jgi:ribokinase